MNTGGRWDSADKPLYFLASTPINCLLGSLAHPYILVAVSELGAAGGRTYQALDTMLDNGVHLLLDSGIFSLASSNAARLRVSPQEVRKLPLEQIEGYEALRDRYIATVEQYADRLWGYIELDWGDTDEKRATRRQLEKRGLRPIPVFHPLFDPPEYFDELCSEYDRICLGNMVGSQRATRIRLISHFVEAKQKYPDVWMHVLGVVPSELAIAYPFDSCDSSAWLRMVRWGATSAPQFARSMLKPFTEVQRGLGHVFGEDGDAVRGANVAIKLQGYDAHFNALNWKALWQRRL